MSHIPAQEDVIAILIIFDRTKALRHTPLTDHPPDHIGGLLDIVLRSGRDVTREHPFGDPSAIYHLYAGEDLFAAEAVHVLGGWRNRDAQRPATRDDTDLRRL